MTKKIRVLECIRQGQIGGGESHLLSLVENLDRSRFEPVVLSFTDGPMIERLQKMGVTTHIIHTVKPFDISKWKKVKQLMKEEKIELVHAHGTRAASNVLWAARSLKIPVIYTVHGWSFHQDQHPLVRTIRVWGEKYLTSRSSINIAVSESNKRSGQQYIPKFSATVINNGIDQKKFSPSTVTSDVRNEFNIKSSTLLVLFIARFTVQKQPLLLIDAFRKALSSVPDMHLLMVGDGDQKQEALAKLDNDDIKRHISFVPFRQDVPALLKAADVFVLPSLWEGLPIGLLEAMAMGKAVIATGVDGTKEVVQDQVNGLLVKTGDVNELTNALVTISRDEALRSRLQAKAMDTVRNQFNAEFMTRKIEEVYSSFFK